MTGPDPRPLCSRYDVAVLDLDGVVYIGRSAVPGAVLGLREARRAGMHLAFVTNNAARPPSVVAAHLVELGIEADQADVVTSAQAAAHLVARQVPPGAPVFVIGGAGLHEALLERGLVPVTTSADAPVAVVQGYGPDMPWKQVIDGAILVREGLPWVVSNTDMSVPTERGPGPGNGALVKLVAEFAGRTPTVAGKPLPPLFEETLERVGGERPLVVGDRVDTDIEGALAMGWDSLLVMSGVTTAGDLAALVPDLRPTYVGHDASCLTTAAAPVVATTGEAAVAGWVAEVRDGALRVRGAGTEHSWWQAAAGVLWGHLDAGGRPADVQGAVPGSVLP